jgi:hypothetical protein
LHHRYSRRPRHLWQMVCTRLPVQMALLEVLLVLLVLLG